MTFQLWHLEADTPREPLRVSPHESVHIHVGTHPIGPGQSVWVTFWTDQQPIHPPSRVDAIWERNSGENSYWKASLGPFPRGVHVSYQVHARFDEDEVSIAVHDFRVGPKVHLALLWHMHQPDYRLVSDAKVPILELPWVRLHALRDYYSMAALVAERPEVHVTVNLTPVLLEQVQSYAEHGATDRHLALTLTPAEELDDSQFERMLETFFDADWHRQIFPHRRYGELLQKRVREESFSIADIQDLQMWSSLAWFGKEFRDGAVRLATGETVDVRPWIEQGQSYGRSQIEEMVSEQMKILRAIIPLHRKLQGRGQIEVSTSPYSHPILPLLVDTDQATLDLLGARLPSRFSHPEDAETQVDLAVEIYKTYLGAEPRGFWPAEGAVSQSTLRPYSSANISWIASDRQVLSRSGRWGYETDNPDVLCQPYRGRQGESAVAMFFRDTELSDAIGFHYQHVTDPDSAAAAFVHELETRFAQQFAHTEDRIVSVAIDGENAWGAYVDDGRPFIRALYRRLTESPIIQTVTFAEYLHGNPERGVAAHFPMETLDPLFSGSWIDEPRSAPGVDFGTWIGEPSENQAWELLKRARQAFADAPSELQHVALRSLLAAEGSDWFWWLGNDQDSGRDDVFDALFRGHIKNVYQALSIEPPEDVDLPLAPRRLVWSVTQPVRSISPGDELVIRTNCPGYVIWQTESIDEQRTPLEHVGGVLAGSRRFQTSLGRVPEKAHAYLFRLECSDPLCTYHNRCCNLPRARVEVRRPPSNGSK